MSPADREFLKPITDEYLKIGRDAMIGNLLGAKDDEMFKPEDDSWLSWSDKKLAEACALSLVEMAIAIKSGKVLKSELRGPVPFGVA